MIAKANNIYNFQYNGTIGAGVADTLFFNLDANNLQLKIVKVVYNLKIIQRAPFENIPVENNKVLAHGLFLGNVLGGDPIGRKVSDFVDPFAGTLYNGDGPAIFNTGEYFYDTFFFSNILECGISLYNFDLVHDVDVMIGVSVEVEPVNL